MMVAQPGGASGSETRYQAACCRAIVSDMIFGVGDEVDPISRLVHETRTAFRGKNFSVALMSTLALVDICAALNSPNGKTEGKKFRAWFTTHVPAEYRDLNAADAYDLRCGLLHQGRTHSERYEAVVFVLPRPDGKRPIDSVLIELGHRKALLIGLEFFIERLLQTVERWWAENRSREPVATHAAQLTPLRYEGIQPWINGTAVLA